MSVGFFVKAKLTEGVSALLLMLTQGANFISVFVKLVAAETNELIT